jgi:RNA polymerase sigma-54 factor
MAQFKQEISTKVVQTQTFELSSHMLQSLELLQLPYLELEQKLVKEASENPLLEEVNPQDEYFKDNTSKEDKFDDFDNETSSNNETYSYSENLDSSIEQVNEENLAREEEYQYNLLDNDPDEAYWNSNQEDAWSPVPMEPEPDFTELLYHEIASCNATSRIKELAKEIVNSLDEEGYLATPLADIAMVADADLFELEEALELVQSFEPVGVGARSLKESLLLQLRKMDGDFSLLEKIITNDLDFIANNKLPALAKKYNISLATLNENLAVLRSLKPAPVLANRSTTKEYVVPEIEFYATENGFDARLLRDVRKRFSIAKRYENLLQTKELTYDERQYISTKLAKAKELLKALELRGSTLLRIGKLLCSIQSGFIKVGIEQLVPLSMKQAGIQLELHETTISRAIDSKYALTPRGVIALRDFFSTTFNTVEDGTLVSTQVVKKRIKEIIDNEDPTKPLSDEKISQLLDEEGILVARRTVAKYRESMHIPGTSLRKQHI